MMPYTVPDDVVGPKETLCESYNVMHFSTEPSFNPKSGKYTYLNSIHNMHNRVRISLS